MSWWESVVLGIVQGLTEFLPISSSAHIRVVGAALPSGGDPGAAFTAVIQLGTLAAVLLFFRRDIARIIGAWVACLLGWNGKTLRARLGGKSPDARLGWWVILGSVPIVVLGVLFKDSIESALRNLWITAVVLVAFGAVLWLADSVGAKKRELQTLNGVDATVLGFAQAAALVPGVSRSGGTISAGLLLGMTRDAAARYSFLLSIPAVAGSALYELFSSSGESSVAGGPGFTATAIAAFVSFVVGYFVIVWFLRILATRSFLPFVIYRFVFAVVIVALLLTNAIPAIQA